MKPVRALFVTVKTQPGRVPGMADMRLKVTRGSSDFWLAHLEPATESILVRMKQYCLRWRPEDQCDVWCDIWANLIGSDSPHPDKIREFVGIVARNVIVQFGRRKRIRKMLPLSVVENEQ